MWSPDLSAFQGPAYKSIAAAIGEGVSSGALKPGDKLPTHRALADQLGVTTGTITRGYAEAERQNLVHARVGSGTYIREPEANCPMFGITPLPNELEGQIDLSYSFALTVWRQSSWPVRDNYDGRLSALALC